MCGNVPQFDIKNGISIAMESIHVSDHPRSILKTKVRAKKVAAELKEKSSLRKFFAKNNIFEDMAKEVLAGSN